MGVPPHAIPSRVRRAVVDVIRPYRSPDKLVGDLATTYGFRSVNDFISALQSAYGEEVAEGVRAAVAPESAPAFAYMGLGASRLADASNYAEAVLAAVPDDWFATAVAAGRNAAINVGFEAVDASGAVQTFDSTVEGLFERNGVPFRFEGNQLVRTGEPMIATQAIQPALAVLDDDRLTDARRFYGEALADLRREDPENAVDEARQAIEAVLLAYIDDHDGNRPDEYVPNRLFNAAAEVDLPREAEELVLGAARYRGRTRAGHAGRPPVSLNDAEAVVGSAAASITFVGRRLTQPS